VTLAQRIGRAIARERHAAGMSQRELAAAADMQLPLVSRIESGTVAVTADAVGRIANAIGCGVGVLYGDERSPAPAGRVAEDLGDVSRGAGETRRRVP
jgi:transcriptional regulator with XRE-family HTH domain